MVDFHKVGLLVVEADRVLLCRKRHSTSKLILPGGRPEPGETHLQCLLRELTEELGAVRAADLEWVGQYQHRASFDDPSIVRTVAIELYRGRLEGALPRAQGELAEVVWFALDDDWSMLAPSLREAIFPDLMARALLPWKPRQ